MVAIVEDKPMAQVADKPIGDWWFARWQMGQLKPAYQICQCCDDHPAECNPLTLVFEDIEVRVESERVGSGEGEEG